MSAYSNLATIHDHIANTADAWPEPDPRLVNGGVRKAPALPLKLFGSLSDYLADLAAAKGSPADYTALAVLCAAAGVIGAARAVSPRQGWVEQCALWGLAVGEPSSGKTAPLETVKRPLAAIERAEGAGFENTILSFETAKKSAELALEAWEASCAKAQKDGYPLPLKPHTAMEPQEPAKPRLLIGSATVEALTRLFAQNWRGLLAVLDEASGLLGDFNRYGGGGDAAFYLSAFNGIFSPTDRVKAGHISADRALLSLVGGIQPERLNELLFSGRSNDGMICRFLAVWPDPIPPVWEVPDVDEDRLNRIFERLRTLEATTDDEGRTAPVVLKLTPQAEDVFRGWYLENGYAAQKGAGLLAEFRGKAKGVVARIALVLEHLEWAAKGGGTPPQAVDVKATTAAAALFEDYFLPMAERVYGDASRPPAERQAVVLLRRIRERGARTLNLREVRRTWGVPGLSQAEPLDAAVKVLEDGDCLRPVESDPRPGRRPKTYVVNPRLEVEQ